MPTNALDNVESVALRSVEKVNQEASTQEDGAEYYNVTVSMMFKRAPKVAISTKKDGTDTDMAPIHKMTVKEILSQLHGQSVTKQSLMSIIANKK